MEVSKGETLGWGQRKQPKGGQQTGLCDTNVRLSSLPTAHPGMSHTGPPSSSVPVLPSGCAPPPAQGWVGGRITGEWVSRDQPALPLCSRKHLPPQLCDRFLSALCVEIVPVVLPDIIYSCLIFPSTSQLPNESRWGAIFPVWVSEHPLFSTPAFEDSTLSAKPTQLQENT